MYLRLFLFVDSFVASNDILSHNQQCHPSIYPFTHLPIHHPFSHLFNIHPYIFSSFHLSSLHLFTHLFIYPCIYLFFHLPTSVRCKTFRGKGMVYQDYEYMYISIHPYIYLVKNTKYQPS